MVPGAGFEPATFRVKADRSIRLSYPGSSARTKGYVRRDAAKVDPDDPGTPNPGVHVCGE